MARAAAAVDQLRGPVMVGQAWAEFGKMEVATRNLGNTAVKSSVGTRQLVNSLYMLSGGSRAGMMVIRGLEAAIEGATFKAVGMTAGVGGLVMATTLLIKNWGKLIAATNEYNAAMKEVQGTETRELTTIGMLVEAYKELITGRGTEFSVRALVPTEEQLAPLRQRELLAGFGRMTRGPETEREEFLRLANERAAEFGEMPSAAEQREILNGIRIRRRDNKAREELAKAIDDERAAVWTRARDEKLRARQEAVAAQGRLLQHQLGLSRTTMGDWIDAARRGPQFSKAILRGTDAAYSAEIRSQYGAEVAQINQRQLKEAERQTAKLGEIARKLVVPQKANLN